ncbi:MAG TPA: hypothetical protein VGL58_18080 [Caulobacteraceae bacterium]|jgi:hypothetical protein
MSLSGHSISSPIVFTNPRVAFSTPGRLRQRLARLEAATTIVWALSPFVAAALAAVW